MVLAGALLISGGLAAVHLVYGIHTSFAWMLPLATLLCLLSFITLALRLQQVRKLPTEALEQITEPCLVLSADNRILFANTSFGTLSNRLGEELIGKSPGTIWETDSPVPPLNELDTTTDGVDQLATVEWELPGGCFFEIKISPLEVEEDSHGKLLLYRDITERQQLSSDNRRLGQAHEVARLGYFTLDIETSEVDFSPDLQRLLKISPARLEEFTNAVHPDDRTLVTNLQSAINDEKTQGQVIRLNHPDGWTMYLRLKIEWERGSHQRLMVVVQDISAAVYHDRKQEWEQKMAALGDMTGGIAHDFNNLLQVILGNVEMVRSRVPSAVSAHLDAITRAGERASNLTQRLLAFAKKQVLEPKLININACIRNLEPKLAGTVSEDVDVQISLHEPLPQCRLDPMQLEDMLMNLTINAAHAMEKGGSLTFTTRVIDGAHHVDLGPGEYVHLSVSDTGQGMTQDVKDRVLEPFFTTRDVGKGVGLGLSSAYGFVVQSGGHLTLDSAPATGTTVDIYLPVYQTMSDDTEVARFSGHALVIEDDAGVNELSVRFLENLGFTVSTAANTDQASKIIDSDIEWSLILCDVMLPQEQKGPEFIKAIWPDGTSIPVIYMSGYTDHSLELQSNERFLPKPFSFRQVTHVVQEALSANTGENETSTGTTGLPKR